MLDHAHDHFACAEIKPELHREKHHGKKDADKGYEKARTIVQQVAYREFNNHWYRQGPSYAGDARLAKVAQLRRCDCDVMPNF